MRVMTAANGVHIDRRKDGWARQTNNAASATSSNAALLQDLGCTTTPPSLLLCYLSISIHPPQDLPLKNGWVLPVAMLTVLIPRTATVAEANVQVTIRPKQHLAAVVVGFWLLHLRPSPQSATAKQKCREAGRQLNLAYGLNGLATDPLITR